MRKFNKAVESQTEVTILISSKISEITNAFLYFVNKRRMEDSYNYFYNIKLTHF